MNEMYPVLKGHGAREEQLEPGEFVDLFLEFNCMSQSDTSVGLTLEIRPKYHLPLKIPLQKECPASTLLSKFEDQFVSDFFTISFVLLVIISGVLVIRWLGWGEGLSKTVRDATCGNCYMVLEQWALRTFSR